MLALSKVQLMSLLQMVNRTEIPLSIVKHWFMIYGKVITKEETEELEHDERRI